MTDIRMRLAARSAPMPSGCIEFTGSITNYGYGQIHVDRHVCLVHRVSWELTNGPIPGDLCVLHRCDNRRCLNVDHLFLGTRADNNADMLAKGRHGSQIKTHCVNGHPLSGDNLMMRMCRGKRFRGCRLCRAASKARERRTT